MLRESMESQSGDLTGTFDRHADVMPPAPGHAGSSRWYMTGTLSAEGQETSDPSEGELCGPESRCLPRTENEPTCSDIPVVKMPAAGLIKQHIGQIPHRNMYDLDQANLLISNKFNRIAYSSFGY